MQQLAAGEVVFLAQIEREFPAGGLGFQAQALLRDGQVLRQRHAGHAFRHAAQRFAHHQPLVQQAQRQRTCVISTGPAEDRLGGVVHLGQPRQAQTAYGGQRLAQPHGVDHLGARRIEFVLAQHPGTAGQPFGADVWFAREQMGVPARRLHARAVAAVHGQASVCPGHPGQGGPDFGQPFQARRVGLLLAFQHRFRQRRGVPGSTDHRHLLPGLECLADTDAHLGLTQHVPLTRLGVFPNRLHHFRHRSEDLGVVSSGLDKGVPPALEVGVARRLGQRREWV